MSRWTPCRWSDFIRRLRQLRFEGPYSGTRHQFMVSGQQRLAIPSNSEYSVPHLHLLIREVEGILGIEITLDSWNRLG